VPTSPDFTETDPEKVKGEVFSFYEDQSGKTLFDGSEKRHLLLTHSYISARIRAEIQAAAEQNLVQFATGDNLGFLAELYGLSRKPAQPAETTLEFRTDGSAASSDIQVPKGTKVATEDGSVEFATDVGATLESGDTSTQVEATATEAGADASGLITGQLNTIVNPIAGIAEAENVTQTTGGTDEEGDEALRQRTRKAPEMFAAAGPEEAYREHARQALPDIRDVAVLSPTAGRVEVYVLKNEGTLPTAGELADVESALSAESVRPLTDTVSAESLIEVPYDIDVEYVAFNGYQDEEEELKNRVSAAVDGYVTWQGRRIGRGVRPQELEGRIWRVEGVKRVSVTSPSVQALNKKEVTSLGARSVSLSGYETR